MVVVDCLVDYKIVGAVDTMQKSKSDGGKKYKADGQMNDMIVVPKNMENM